jgi:tetratricopeptide (TPR) repeat protein
MNPPRRGLRRRNGHRLRGSTSTLAALALIVVGAFASGCDQLSARRHIQNGTSLYEDDKYEEAAAEFEAGLALEPSLAVGQYNAGLTYYKLFRAGVDTPENKAFAEKAVAHFQAWLKSNPKDRETQEIVSEIWVNSKDYEKALAYWQAEHDAQPREAGPITQLASINFKAGRFDETVKWYVTAADVEPKLADKVLAFLSVGRLARLKLDEGKTFGEDRVRMADLGIAALQKAAELDPKNIEAEFMQGVLYNYRSLAHGAFWAGAVDRAIGQHHSARGRVLREEARKAQGQAAPAPQPGSGQAGG